MLPTRKSGSLGGVFGLDTSGMAIGDERRISSAEEFEDPNMGLSGGDTSKLRAKEGLFAGGV